MSPANSARIDSRAWTDREREALDDLRSLASRRMLVVYDHVPRPESSGADLRLVQILEILARAGHRVTFIGRGASSPASAFVPLQALGIEVVAPDPDRSPWEETEAPHIDLPRLLSERRFDFALLYQYFWVGIGVAEQYLPVIRAHSPHTRVVLLSDDCHWLREQRRGERAGGRAELERSRGLRAKENFTYTAADLVLTITAEDAARMRDDLPDLEPQVVHFCQDEIPEHVPGFESRSGLLFIGSGANDANTQSVRWFTDEIWPLVRVELPRAQLSIVGAPPAGGWTHMTTPGVVVVGQASDLTQHVDAARVFVSPITYGTGLKTKNVQALGRGLPMVLTSISAEGMELHGDEAAFVRDDPRAFAKAVVDLCTDEPLWRATSERALRHARTHFGRETTIRDLTAALRLVLASPARTARGLGPGAIVELETADSRHRRPERSRARVHIELARRHRAEGRFDEAKQAIRNVFCEMCCLPVDAPVYSQLHALLAVVYLASGEFEEAGLAAREAVRLQPELAGEPREALERVLATVDMKLADDSARARSNTDVPALLEAGKAAFRAGELDRAVELLLSALHLDERCGDAWNSLGVLLHSIGDPGEAMVAFERAVALSPADRESRLNRAELACTLGLAAIVRSDAEELLARDPDDPDARALLAECAKLAPLAAPPK